MDCNNCELKKRLQGEQHFHRYWHGVATVSMSLLSGVIMAIIVALILAK